MSHEEWLNEVRSTLKIQYKDNNGNDLGCYEYTNFAEVLIPDFNDGFQYYINIKFTGNTNFVWKVLDIEIQNHPNVIIHLEAIPSYTSSLAHVAAGKQKHPKDLIKEYSIVEVEFGFFEKVYNGASTSSNRHYSKNLLSGEMHKRRPCILFSFGSKTAQIIPLTTKLDDITVFDVEMNLRVVKDLSKKYHRDTYALLKFMQSVSYDRIFAPFLANGSASFTTDQVISGQNRTDLKDKLLKYYKVDDEVTKLTVEIEKLNTERYKHIEKVKAKAHLLNNKIAELEQISDLLLKIGKDVGEGNDLTTIITSIKKRHNIM